MVIHIKWDTETFYPQSELCLLGLCTSNEIRIFFSILCCCRSTCCNSSDIPWGNANWGIWKRYIVCIVITDRQRKGGREGKGEGAKGMEAEAEGQRERERKREWRREKERDGEGRERGRGRERTKDVERLWGIRRDKDEGRHKSKLKKERGGRFRLMIIQLKNRKQ